MASNIQPISTSISFKQKMSIAAAIISGVIFLVTSFGDAWGFAGVAKQIVQTLSAILTVINMWFGGTTTQQVIEERKENGKDN